MDVEVGPNDTVINVVVVGGAPCGSYLVPPGKKAQIPVPPVPPGTQLYVSVGKGLRARILLVEVIASF